MPPVETSFDGSTSIKTAAKRRLSSSADSSPKRLKDHPADLIRRVEGHPPLLDMLLSERSMSKANHANVSEGRMANSNASLGTRKLVIKNLRPVAISPQADYCRRLWDHIDKALGEIYCGKQLSLPLALIYRDVEDVCHMGDDEKERLYRLIMSGGNSYLEHTLLPTLPKTLPHDLSRSGHLKAVYRAWQSWNLRSMQIRSVFSFLDRSYLLKSSARDKVSKSAKRYQLNDLTILQFRDIILKRGQFDEHIYLGMCELIGLSRTNQTDKFDPDLLRAAVLMLHVVGLYKTTEGQRVDGFEPVLIGQSEIYFQELGSSTWAQFNLKAYALACEKLLEKENTICDEYNLDIATKRALLKSARSILVVRCAARLTDTDGVGQLLQDHEVVALRALYEMLKASGMEAELKGPWEQYIRKIGSSIVNNPEKIDTMVVDLLRIKKRLEVIIRDAFNQDERFKFALREAYGNFINDRKNTTSWGVGQSIVGEVIAKYIDLLLRGGLKAVPSSLASDTTDRKDAESRGIASTGDEDAELDRQLEQGIELFRFIQGKDVFEAFYKKDLARRLLMARSASQDAERSMLTKLKSECGSNFTHNLEQMFKDQEISRDEMVSYKQSLSNTSKTTLDLQVSVLSSAAWPTYPDVEVRLPSEVARHIEKFDRHYKHKHSGRKLAWKHALAHSIVKASFNKGPKELVVSGFQAIVLVLFNDIGKDGNLSYPDIQSATGLVDAELQRTLQSLACAKIRVLNKHPKGREVAKTDTFTVNTTFTDPKYRIKINQIQLKETKEDIQETHERVAQDRQYETQAAIVRIMKSRKQMSHGALVAEVIDQTKGRGAVELGEIKRNIEKLIEKDYIERDGSSYTYLA